MQDPCLHATEVTNNGDRVRRCSKSLNRPTSGSRLALTICTCKGSLSFEYGRFNGGFKVVRKDENDAETSDISSARVSDGRSHMSTPGR
jgi:hypothetical protein